MLVKIYIETDFSGRFNCGSGKYACVLEVEWQGQPVSKTHYGAWSDISIQRLQLRACITAMEHITRESDIEIYINAPALVSQFDARMQELGEKNEDLWERLRKLCQPHLVAVFHQKRNLCTPALQTDLKSREIPAKPDKEYRQERLP